MTPEEEQKLKDRIAQLEKVYCEFVYFLGVIHTAKTEADMTEIIDITVKYAGYINREKDQLERDLVTK
jgi:tRNA U34 5-carboxymethylaminomethyl modifying enzyme MnmG/GidA